MSVFSDKWYETPGDWHKSSQSDGDKNKDRRQRMWNQCTAGGKHQYVLSSVDYHWKFQWSCFRLHGSQQ